MTFTSGSEIIEYIINSPILTQTRITRVEDFFTHILAGLCFANIRTSSGRVPRSTWAISIEILSWSFKKSMIGTVCSYGSKLDTYYFVRLILLILSLLFTSFFRWYPYLALFLSIVVPTIVPWWGWGENLWYAWHWTVTKYCINLNITWSVNSAAHMWGVKPFDKYALVLYATYYMQTCASCPCLEMFIL